MWLRFAVSAECNTSVGPSPIASATVMEARHRLLFLSTWHPHPPSNGSKLRVSSLLRALAQRFEVDLISFGAERGCGADADSLIDLGLCHHAVVLEESPFRLSRVRLITGLLTRTPRHYYAMHSSAMAHAVRRAAAKRDYDLVIASNLPTVAYLGEVPGARQMLEEHNFQGRLLAERAAASSSVWQAWRAGAAMAKDVAWERRVFSRFDLVTMVSEQDRQAAIAAGCNGVPISVVPNGVTPASAEERAIVPEGESLVYAGSVTYGPNLEAVGWFAREVWPQVRAEVPGAELLVTGDTADVNLRELELIPGLRFTGHVVDVRRLVAGRRLSVVPLFSGGGTRLKVLESLALGTPVVSTAKGVEGLDIEAGQHYLQADEPAQFAVEVLRLLRDDGLRHSLAEAGRQAVESRYDWTKIGADFADRAERLMKCRH